MCGDPSTKPDRPEVDRKTSEEVWKVFKDDCELENRRTMLTDPVHVCCGGQLDSRLTVFGALAVEILEQL